MITDQPIGDAVLYVSSNVAAAAHEAFSEWCDSIHHFDTMRIDGFLSLRRFELERGTVSPGVTQFRLLTLYQVRDARDADFSTPSYAHHTATYTPPPDGVVDAITYERAVLERAAPPGIRADATQPVGSACVTVTGAPGDAMALVLDTARRHPDVLNAYLASRQDEAVVLADVADVERGRSVLEALEGVEHGGARRSIQLFAQVFPRVGVLGRDRVVIAPRPSGPN